MHETDYLIIGAGAMGMAFADTLLTETDATITIVDRYAKPGGHWNFAYSFVTLHQPSQFYGVASKELSKGRIDKIGLNKGLFDLASGAEVQAYYDELMRDTFLPSGRVQYFPLCDYKGNNEFESLITGEKHQVKVNKKIVDATYLKTGIPAKHTPNFTVAEGVQFMPLNDLVNVQTKPAGFVIIGGGKTGMDACLWLLGNGVNPEDITWIVSRDAWLSRRETTQPTLQFFEQTMGTQAAQMEAIAQASSVADLFDRLEKAGVWCRIDESREPEMFHGATVSEPELEQMRRIKNVVRLGHVKHIDKNEIVFVKGTFPTTTNHIHVDCSASAITNLEVTPVFKGNVITPQTIRSYQPTFSASMIAYVEANYDDEKTKNKLCNVVQLPNRNIDWLPMTASQMLNQFNWSQDKKLRRWIRDNRLDGFGKVVREVDRNDTVKMAILKKFRDNAMPAMMNLQKLIETIDFGGEKTALTNPQFQVRRDMFFKGRLMSTPQEEFDLEEGDILVKVEKFAYTANNITYAVAGDMIGYWKFFPPFGENTNGWGVIPVWGFAEVVDSKTEAIPVGDRLFGYFPPATHLKMTPFRAKEGSFVDGAAHRAKLPAGYNFYRRVLNEKHYNPAFDRERMLLFPLHLTSFCIWDALQDKDWHGAEQIIILSASSKTSTGLGYALKADENAPKVIGMTSKRNLKMVESLALYDESTTYDQASKIDASIPTVIVDMSGNQNLLAELHTHLGDNMKWTINVGLTHWTNAQPQKGVNTEKSEFFFAPGHIQRRMKEWTPAGFDKKSTAFLMQAAAQTKKWLKFRELNSLEELAAIHGAVCEGKIPANEGIIVQLQ